MGQSIIKPYLRVGDKVSFIDNKCRVKEGSIKEFIYEGEQIIIDTGSTLYSIEPELVFLKRSEAIDYIIDNDYDYFLNRVKNNEKH